MQIILSSSKTQDMDCRQFPTTSIPLFLDRCEELVKRLQTYDVEDLASLMKMSSKLAELTWSRFDNFTFPPTPAHSRQALLTFQGDVFSGIDSDQYNEADFSFAQKHLRILSGLYGILRPLDLIQPYRLEMAARFSAKKEDSLYSFWQESITQQLNKDLQEEQPTLLNLASTEYSRVIDKKKLKATIVDVTFKEKKGDTFKVVAIHAKRARGKMVDYIIKNRITSADLLQNFSEDGYRYKKELSTNTLLTFHR
jgi:uncharacterized protein